MRTLKKFASILLCLSILCFIGMGSSAGGRSNSESSSVIMNTQRVYAEFTDRMAPEIGEDFYGGAYITENNELTICIVETSPVSKRADELREEIQAQFQASKAYAENRDIANSSDAIVNTKSVKFSLKQLKAAVTELTEQMDSLGIQAVWPDQETNTVRVILKAADASQREIRATVSPYISSDGVVFEEANPDLTTSTTAKIYVQGGTAASSSSGGIWRSIRQ